MAALWHWTKSSHPRRLACRRNRLERGKKLVLKGNCVICHPIGDKDAKKVAPNLTGYLSEEWLKEFIKNPSDPKFYGYSRLPS